MQMLVIDNMANAAKCDHDILITTKLNTTKCDLLPSNEQVSFHRNQKWMLVILENSSISSTVRGKLAKTHNFHSQSSEILGISTTS